MSTIEIRFTPARSSTAAATRPSRSIPRCSRNPAIAGAAVPSGASTGSREALELRDGGDAFGGKAVTRAVANVNGEIASAIRGRYPADQRGLDDTLIALTAPRRQTPHGRKCACSACRWRRRAPRPLSSASRCGAISAARRPTLLPIPAMNVLNGGVHADNRVDFQEFMIAPAAPTRSPTRCGSAPRSTTICRAHAERRAALAVRRRPTRAVSRRC